MKYEKFLEIIKNELKIDTSFAIRYNNVKEETIGVQWTAGGKGGGSCWDDSNHPAEYYSISADHEPEFENLDKILERFSSRLSFMAYKKLYREIVKTGEYSENEYYGNYTHYMHKYVSLKDLHEYLFKGK